WLILVRHSGAQTTSNAIATASSVRAAPPTRSARAGIARPTSDPRYRPAIAITPLAVPRIRAERRTGTRTTPSPNPATRLASGRSRGRPTGAPGLPALAPAPSGPSRPAVTNVNRPNPPRASGPTRSAQGEADSTTDAPSTSPRTGAIPSHIPN